jgi:hypothetical protein
MTAVLCMKRCVRISYGRSLHESHLIGRDENKKGVPKRDALFSCRFVERRVAGYVCENSRVANDECERIDATRGAPCTGIAPDQTVRMS